jgi:cation diffusion facilitator family transporter
MRVGQRPRPNAEPLDRSERRLVLAAAIGANLAIAIVKFIAAAVSGSISVAAEGIHSLVDTGDGLLLVVGRRLARRPADADFPFGRGKEVYFWSLVVAMVIFGAGGALTFYEGISHVHDQGPLEDPTWSYVVLGSAAVLESISLGIAVRSLRRYRARRMPRRSLLATIRAAKDPTVFTVVLEDSAALVGLSIAFFGVAISHVTGNALYDGIASCLIGLVLATIAIVLGGCSSESVLCSTSWRASTRSLRLRRVSTGSRRCRRCTSARTRSSRCCASGCIATSAAAS